MAAKSRSTKKASSRKAAVKKAPAKKPTPKKKPAPKKSGSSTRAGSAAAPPYIVQGTGSTQCTLTVYRGEAMVLLAMNWAAGKQPPANFVGFAIEYMSPGETQFFPVKNRLSFLDNSGNVNANILTSRLSPIQKFRWIHFPFQTAAAGDYTYRVTPVFMDDTGVLSYGDFQQAAINLGVDTYPGQLNIAFTRGFIASQAFVDDFGTNGGVGTLLPEKADDGLTFRSTDPKEAKALDWMGFEARQAILAALDQAIADTTAQVRVTAYDFNEPEIVNKLVKVGSRLKIIIDNSGTHARAIAPEAKAATMLTASAGAANVQRQHMGDLQHCKTIVIKGAKVQLAVGGSTNFSWRGFFVQNNNAVIVQGATAVQVFLDDFDNLWANPGNVAAFAKTASSGWNNLGLKGIDAQVSFSPHTSGNARLPAIATDIASTTSCLLYSLAFLYEEPGAILTSIENVAANNNLLVYGLSDKTVGGLDLQKPDGNPPIAFPATLLTNVPQPFKAEAGGGFGTTMHHKFVVIDFNKPTARVYTGSHNFSSSADLKNSENLFLIKDQRVAVSYMVEAVTMFDHYEFLDAQAKSPDSKLFLQKPPGTGEKAWWEEDYSNPAKARDRELFSVGD